jgi:glucose/arabinose dehydrogenase
MRILAPEYGGDGKAPAQQGKYIDPVIAFPAHWAPNDLLMYSGKSFPNRYRNGAFIAFHGSWNRAPLPQAGYKVVFVPFAQGKLSATWETFADGFAGDEIVDNHPANAAYRPVGLATDRAGSLYVMDSIRGRIWRIDYVGV